jgi:nicotinamide mononucleotide adenylyltransferase
MCELAVEEKRESWLMVDPWEALQPDYKPTAQILHHFNHEINEVLGGAQKADGTRSPMRIMLLAGADLIQTMSTPGQPYTVYFQCYC